LALEMITNAREPRKVRHAGLFTSR